MNANYYIEAFTVIWSFVIDFNTLYFKMCCVCVFPLNLLTVFHNNVVFPQVHPYGLSNLWY